MEPSLHRIVRSTSARMRHQRAGPLGALLLLASCSTDLASAAFSGVSPKRLDASSAPTKAPRSTLPPKATFPKYRDVSPTHGIEKTEYQVNVGRAIDRLRGDYPQMLREEPDFSIFSPNILLKASNRQIEGISQYERAFYALRLLRNSTMTKDEVTFRMVTSGDTIRVRWNAKLWVRDPRMAFPGIFGDEAPVIVVDGVSVYEVNATGFIHTHRLENVEITPTGVKAALDGLLFAWPRAEVASPAIASPFATTLDHPFAAKLEQALENAFGPEERVLQIASGAPTSGHAAAAPDAAAAADVVRVPVAVGGMLPSRPGMASTAARGRTPVPVLLAGETPMERAARERAEDTEKAKQLSALRAPKAASGRSGAGALGGLLGAFKDMAAPQGCESSYDCERPQVCCDLGFAHICCNSGMMIGMPQVQDPVLQPQAIPIPVDRGNGGGSTGVSGYPGSGNGFPTPP